jgi:hypothetical protein
VIRDWDETDEAAMEEYRNKPELTVMFNPLNFTIEENNQMLADGWEPLPVHMWRRTARLEAIIADRDKHR